MRAISLVALLATCLIGACASAPPVAEPPKALYADPSFGPPTESITTDDVFTVSDAMRRYLTVDIADQLHVKGAQIGLIDALYRKPQLKLEYDAARTKTAAESFADRSGNCLSLVIMTAALARELRLSVIYQSAYLDRAWSRSGNLLLAAAHVNVTVGRRIMDAGSSRDLSPTTVDFLPPDELRRMRVHEVGEATILAMYANNRAAEALTRGRIDDAYAWAVLALQKDPSFFGAYNTLGVIYLQHGEIDRAADVFAFVLAYEPINTRALANLAETDERLGRNAEAGALKIRLAEVESVAPFHFFDLGIDAMRRADYIAARDFFAREVARDADYHEFHFWLGVADYQLGDVVQAKKQLELAAENSLTRGQHDLYAAKLDWLRAHRSQ